MAGYYDVVLALIPVSVLGITGLMLLAGTSLTLAVSTGSLTAVGLLGHAMFVNAPGQSDGPAEVSETGSSDAGYAAD